MTSAKLTRSRAALLGCGLAIVGCYLAPTPSGSAPRRLVALPELLGSWEVVDTQQLPAREAELLEASDHWRRTYRCRNSKRIVVVTAVTGPGGPLVSHRPEICYSRQLFCSHSTARRWAVPNRSDMFRFQTFQPRQIDQPAVTVAYAWHDGSRWRAPRVPRMQLARHATLERLQISMRHPRGMASEAESELQQFIQLATDATGDLESRPANSPRAAIQSPTPDNDKM